MTSLQHDAVMRFTSRSRQHCFEHSIRRRGLQEHKPHMPRGVGGQLPSPAGLGNQGLVQ